MKQCIGVWNGRRCRKYVDDLSSYCSSCQSKQSQSGRLPRWIPETPPETPQTSQKRKMNWNTGKWEYEE